MSPFDSRLNPGFKPRRTQHRFASARILCKRFFVLLLLPAACAHSTALRVDLAKPVDTKAYNAAIEGLHRCTPDSFLAISYAFGQLELKVDVSSKPCRIEISAIGELTPQGRRQKFICQEEVLTKISWLYQETVLRERPPVRELRQISICEVVMPMTEHVELR